MVPFLNLLGTATLADRRVRYHRTRPTFRLMGTASPDVHHTPQEVQCGHTALEWPYARNPLVAAAARSSSSRQEVDVGGIEEQQVDFEMEQARHLAEDTTLQHGLSRLHQVHDLMEVMHLDGRQVRHHHVVGYPVPHRAPTVRGKRPRGHQRKEQALHREAELAVLCQPRTHLVQVQWAPQLVQEPRPPQGAAAEEPQAEGLCLDCAACSGLRRREGERLSRRMASRSTCSSRPKL
jgi:hypothetical protein